MTLLAISVVIGIVILDILEVQRINLNAVLVIGIIYVVPSLLLLIEYMLISSRISIQIVGKEILIIQNNLTLNYQYSDILNVTKFCSYPFSQNRTRCYLATDCYYFIKIKMNDNKEFIVTSLMTDFAYNQFVVNKTEARLFPSINFS